MLAFWLWPIKKTSYLQIWIYFYRKKIFCLLCHGENLIKTFTIPCTQRQWRELYSCLKLWQRHKFCDTTCSMWHLTSGARCRDPLGGFSIRANPLRKLENGRHFVLDDGRTGNADGPREQCGRPVPAQWIKLAHDVYRWRHKRTRPPETGRRRLDAPLDILLRARPNPALTIR